MSHIFADKQILHYFVWGTAVHCPSGFSLLISQHDAYGSHLVFFIEH